MYYEIVRFDNQGPDREDFEAVRKMVRRGWLRKAAEHMRQWDCGPENEAVAIACGNTWATPQDDREPTDRVLREDGGQFLCMADPSVNGGYEAYYLSAPLGEDD